jgi:hypothetical protein
VSAPASVLSSAMKLPSHAGLLTWSLMECRSHFLLPYPSASAPLAFGVREFVLQQGGC